jgi:hypothetical protein
MEVTMQLIKSSCFIGFLICVHVLSGLCVAEETDSTELQKLRERAQKAISDKKDDQVKEEEIVFKSGGLSLQSLNPELSVTGDMFGQYQYLKGQQNGPQFIFRGLGLHFESYLDPFSKFKAAVPVSTDGVELGEAYFTHFGLLPGFTVTFGKFRQQFGVINRWHKHGLDQLDFPLPLRMIFGDGGLNQIGISSEWVLPFSRDISHDLIIQVTNGENGRLFGGNILSIPSVLGHYKVFRDITKSTYMELGITGLFGWNDKWDVISGDSTIVKDETLGTRVYGLDFVVLWEPTNRMRYRNIEWRTELYLLDRDLLDPAAGSQSTLNAYGGYSYLQTKLSRTLDLGFRFDYYKPDQTDPLSADILSSFANSDGKAHRWQMSPYLTWYQSPFVRFRVEYDYCDGKAMGQAENSITVQAIFAAGPHKHERY